ncbi:MAG: phage major capsid protein, partial [Deltaproteobacteria bacterium]|nr:phage major capsid protein [Deltaproteobacteria bacterium]
MTKLQKLIAKRELNEDRMKAILALEWTDELRTEYDGLEKDVDVLDGDIEREGRAEARAEAEKKPAEPAESKTEIEDPESRGKVVVGENREELKPWNSFGEKLIAVHAFDSTRGRVIDPRLFPEARAASGMNEGTPSDGGFLVGTQEETNLLEKVYTDGELLSKCDEQLIGAGKNGIKVPTIDETSRANGSRQGGVLGYWAAEAAEVTASAPKIGSMSLELNKLMALVYLTDELLEDAVAIESWVMRKLPKELRFKAEDAIYNGTGAGQMQGILNAKCTVSVAEETGQAADTINAENIEKMWMRCYGYSRKNAVWLINQDTEAQLNGMVKAVGTGGVPVYLPAGGLSASPYSSLYGRPVIPVEYAATLG